MPSLLMPCSAHKRCQNTEPTAKVDNYTLDSEHNLASTNECGLLWFPHCPSCTDTISRGMMKASVAFCPLCEGRVWEQDWTKTRHVSWRDATENSHKHRFDLWPFRRDEISNLIVTTRLNTYLLRVMITKNLCKWQRCNVRRWEWSIMKWKREQCGVTMFFDWNGMNQKSEKGRT